MTLTEKAEHFKGVILSNDLKMSYCWKAMQFGKGLV